MDIIKAKINSPKMDFSKIYRLDVVNKMKSNKNKNLFIITGFPGSGKSTIAYQFLERVNLPYVWYNLDENDNDPKQFSLYLHRALIEKGVEFAVETDGQNLSEVINGLLNYYEKNHSKELFMVLDDYESIEDEKINELIYRMLLYAPKNLHVIIISQVSPEFNISKLTLKNRAMLITGKDLRLTPEEIQNLFKVHKFKINSGKAEKIHKLTGGWLSGVILIIINYEENAKELPDNPENFENYFNYHVLTQLDESEKNILMAASLFKLFTKELIRAVSGISNAGEILDRLQKYNLFIENVGDNEFKLNNMFSNYLIRLTREAGKAEFYYERAGDFVKESDKEEAVDFYIKGKNIEKAAKLMENFVDGSYLSKNYNRVSKWISNFTLENIVNYPHLLHLKQITARLESDYKLFKKICDIFDNKYVNTRYYYLSLYEQALDFNDRGEIEKSEKICRKIIENIEKSDNLYFAVHNIMGTINIWKNNDEEAKKHFMIAEEGAYESGYIEFYNLIKANRLLPEIEKGNLDNPEKELEKQLKESEGSITIYPLLLLAKIKYMRMDIEAGIKYGRKALKLARESKYKYGIIKSLNSLFYGYLYSNKIDKALNIIDSAFETVRDINDMKTLVDIYFNKLLIEVLRNNYEVAKGIVNLMTENEFTSESDRATYTIYREFIKLGVGDIEKDGIKLNENIGKMIGKAEPEYFIYKFLMSLKNSKNEFSMKDYIRDLEEKADKNKFLINETLKFVEILRNNNIILKEGSPHSTYEKISVSILKDGNIYINRNNGLEKVKFNSKIAKELFLYLVFHKDKIIPREKLIDEFWNDKDYDKAGHLLRDYVYMIKKAFGSEKVIVYRHKGYGLADTINWDIDYYRMTEYFHRGEVLMEKVENIEAVKFIKMGLSLYNTSPLKNCYYDWCQVIENEIEETVFNNHLNLVRTYINIGEYNEAEKILNKLKKEYPLEEILYQWLMKLYYIEGRKGRIKRIYNELCEIYGKELDLSPTERSKELFEKFLNIVQ